MAIEKNETIKERYKFSKTKEWIDEEFIKLENKFNHYEEKISSLKKSSGGTYSDDLLLAQKVFEFVTKNLHKYKEAKEQPYFARIDFREKRREAESFYIGKFGLNDEEQSEEVVIDWRAPLANLYYSGTFGQSYYNSPAGIVEGELSLKRKFLVKDGNIAEMFDEGINELIVKTSAEGDGLVDEFLKVTLEQSMSKKLKDVVATIQKEQNEIIRAYKNKPIIIQGSAGSGKTTVALHRLAYLIYTYSNEEKNGNILVVAPNKLFLDYISDVLPNLGVYNVKQNTYEELCVEIMKVKGKIITKDEKLSQIIECEDSNKIKYITSSSKVKGSLVFKSILDRYIKYLEAKDTEVEDIEVEGYILFTSKEVKRLYIRDLAHLPAKKRKDEIKKYFESKMKYKISDLEELIDKDYGLKIRDIKSNNSFSEEKKREIIINIYDERDEKKKSLKSHSTKALKEFFTNWKSLDLYKSYSDLFNDENVFKDIAKDIIPDKLYQYMREELNHNHEKKVIDSDDLTPLTYLKLKFEGNTVDKFMHIVVDEAQDYSYFQMYLLNEISQNNSMTIVGDLGQGIYNYKGIGSWNKLIESVFREDGTYISLSQSYRSTVEIINLANKVLEKQKLHLTPAIPVLRHGDNPKIIKVPSKDHEVSIIDSIIQEVHEKKKHSVAVICKNYSQCKELYKVLSKKSSYSWILVNNSEKNINMERLIIPSYMTKGLEFDATIIYECEEENYNDNDLDKRLLYVALTRALHLEYIMYSNSLTKLLE
ncbi:RNA polymerase recycling motor HelD [Clostridium tunisiense]|uniref:RNA polymerase recycling motor HelD n=1 Tax=Clostridium tunisiense TaxID=219748 RepID=UPI0002E75E0D|nr:RNA polymerase recycling motor HelD [Clostridium tunisiense]